MARYSAFALLRNALNGHASWQPAWRSPELKPSYDFVIIGGGGHGLATAYYLAKNHGAKNIGLIERGWIGGGNTGRNTTVIRSNYLYPASAAVYDFALHLYEGLSTELNYNIMLSQRGVVLPAYSRHDLEMASRAVNAMQLNGIDAELLDREQTLRAEPLLNSDPDARYPVLGGVVQRRGGTARHDAVVWGYARGASALGVDIIQNCEVTGLAIRGGRIAGVSTTLGNIQCDRVGVAVAGNSTLIADMAKFPLPVRSMTLQAAVTEPLKPVLNTVVMAVSGPGIYASQTDKGDIVFGGALDLYASYAQRGNIPTMQRVVAGLLETFPSLARVKLMRQWGGTVDVVPDSSPIIDEMPVGNLFFNCGWGTGGFKAIPAGGWLLAHLLATGEHHEISKPFGLGRFTSMTLVDEAGAAGISH